VSPARVLIAVALASILAVAAFLVLRHPATGSESPARLLAFDPAHAAAINISRPDGRTETVRRGDRLGEWVIALPRTGGADEWPANAGNVRAALRILSTLEATRSAETGSPMGARGTVSVTMDDGSGVSMSLDSRTLAGQALARAESPRQGAPVWVDASLADMLLKDGPREWRDVQALPDVGNSARITIQSGAAGVSLARLQGRWVVREPVSEAAEPEAVTRLAAALASVQILDFLDGGAPGAMDLDAPAAVITLEWDRRDAQTGKSSTIRSSLKIGAPSGVSSKGVFASLARPGVPERTVVVSAEPLAGLSPDPASYIARRAVSVPSAEIAAVTIGDRRFARSLNGWQTPGRDGGLAIPVSPSGAESIGALLKLLTESPAQALSLDPPLENAGVPVELRTLGDVALPPLAVSLETDVATHAPVLLLQSGHVARRYTGKDAAALWPWISGE
jgi:hypothetical protein